MKSILLYLFLISFSFAQTLEEYGVKLDELSNYQSVASNEFYESLQKEIIRINESQVDRWTLPKTENSYYCSNGRGGDGSKSSPWNLFDALEGKYFIKPNSTIYIFPDTYKRRPKERIDIQIAGGSKSEPIIIRPLYGNVIIDGGLAINYNGNNPNVNGIWICGLEITISEPMHLSGDDNVTRPTGGVWFAGGDNCKLINNVIHNVTSSGLNIWSASKNTDVYGNIVYDNGYVGSGRAHGHAAYSQNKKPSLKLFRNNIFSAGPEGFTKTLALQVYGSPASSVENYIISNNVFLGRVIVGRTGESGSNSIFYVNNYQDKGGFNFGYLSDNNGRGIYRDNTLVGGSVSILHWDTLIASNNKIIANNPNRHIGDDVKKYHEIVKFGSGVDIYSLSPNVYQKNRSILVGIDRDGSGDISFNSPNNVSIFKYNDRDNPVFTGSGEISLKNYVTKDPENGLDSVIQPFIIIENSF